MLQWTVCLIKSVVNKKGKLKVAHTRLPSVWVPELIPVLGSQPAGDVSHKPGGRLPLLSARPAVTLANLKKRAATNFAGWWTEARWVWTVCLRLLLDSVAAAIWTQALLCPSPARKPLGYRATLTVVNTCLTYFVMYRKTKQLFFCIITSKTVNSYGQVCIAWHV